MGSASREALASTQKVLNTLQLEVGHGRELLQISAVLSRSPQLLAALADPAAPAESKTTLIDRAFDKAHASVRVVLNEAVSHRWSNAQELVAGIEELGIRAESHVTHDLYAELLGIEKAIGQSHELELTLGSKLGAADAKVKTLATLFTGKVSEAALAIVEHLVTDPRGRRLGRALQEAARISADQQGAALATVALAAPIDAIRLSRLQDALAKSAGRPVKISTVIDPELIGGIRIHIGDEVIDGSVKSRLDDLRLQLAG